LTFGISFDFWNTLYGNGDELERYKRRVEYFYNIISSYKKIDINSVEKAFQASTEFFVHEWQINFRTPTTSERIHFMSRKLDVDLKRTDLDKTAEFFGNLIFSVPPQSDLQNLTVVRQLAEKCPLGLISDTGYISGKYIRMFLTKQKIISYFDSLVFSDEQAHCKPHSSVFKITCHNLKIAHSHLIHIGDLEKTDIRGARDLGGIGIKYTGWKNNSTEVSLADYTIDKYPELFQLITRIVNR
jgi:FMN phosphatase YigB (HAD superfamily)